MAGQVPWDELSEQQQEKEARKLWKALLEPLVAARIRSEKGAATRRINSLVEKGEKRIAEAVEKTVKECLKATIECPCCGYDLRLVGQKIEKRKDEMEHYI